MYVVNLLQAVKNSRDALHRVDYFPRKFYYLRDARRLAFEVEEAGGRVSIVRLSRDGRGTTIHVSKESAEPPQKEKEK